MAKSKITTTNNALNGESRSTPGAGQSSSSGRTRKPRGPGWEKSEDVYLCMAWVHVSTDPIKGTDQDSNTLWKGIYDYFLRLGGSAERRTTPGSLSSRWHNVQTAVSLFCGMISDIENARGEPVSGTQPPDDIKKALEKYKAKVKSEFAFMHCYEVLKDEEKFRIRYNSVKNDELPAPVDRPQGRKAAKEKAKEEASRKRKFDDSREKLVRIEEKQLALSQQRFALQEAMEEAEVMRTKLDDLDEIAREYFTLRRAEVLERIKARRAAAAAAATAVQETVEVVESEGEEDAEEEDEQ